MTAIPINPFLNSPIDLHLPAVPETDNPELYGQLSRVYTALRNLQIGTGYATGTIVDPAATPGNTIQSQNLNQFYAIAAQNIAAGDMCYGVDDGSGNLKIHLANAASDPAIPLVGLPATFVCNNTGGVLTGANGLFIAFSGLCALYGGLTVGATYYLSATTAGKITTTPPVQPNLIQPVGFAISATALLFNTNGFIDQAHKTFDQL